MAHVRYVTIATPHQHEYMLEQLRSREYWVECDTFQGYSKPQIAEVKVFDTRIKKEAVPQFVRDMSMMDTGVYRPNGTNYSHHMPHRRLLSWITRLFRKLVNHKSPDTRNITKVTPFHKAGGWQYTFLIGTYDDPHNARGVEEI